MIEQDLYAIIAEQSEQLSKINEKHFEEMAALEKEVSELKNKYKKLDKLFVEERGKNYLLKKKLKKYEGTTALPLGISNG